MLSLAAALTIFSFEFFLRSLIKLQIVLKQDGTYVMTWSILPCAQEHIIQIELKKKSISCLLLLCQLFYLSLLAKYIMS